MKHLSLQLIGFTLAAALGATAAHADVYTVGSGAGCTHGTIQEALDAADARPGADTVRITRSSSYHAVAANVTTAQELTIEGGYATCTQAEADATNTVITGSRLWVHAGTDSIVRVRRLELRDHVGGIASKGGAIYFEGDGILEISDSFITNNSAMYGGGISAEGTGGHAELVIGANVVISNNTADYYGGGIYADQIEMSMLEPGSILMLNHAPGISGNYGYGGGLYIHAGNRSSYAYIGSSGVGNLGAIWGNTARYGGGVAMGGSADEEGEYNSAELRLFTTDPAHPARIAGNSASVKGGAIYAKSNTGSFDGDVTATARVWNANIEDNHAPDGAVAFLEGDSATLIGDAHAEFYFNFNTPPAGAVPCAPGAECGRISGNTTSDDSGNLTDGAIFRGTTHSFVGFSGAHEWWASIPLPRGGTVVSGNKGGRLYYDGGDDGRFAAVNALITANQFSHELVRLSDNSLFIHDSTIAGNTIGAGNLFATFDAAVEIQRSLLWQPGLVMLDRHAGTMAVDHVIASEIESLGGNYGGGGDCGDIACAVLLDPQFVDPAHGDYTLRASSPAIDMAPAVAGDDRDALGNPRDQDLPFIWDDHGPRDIGAYERQSLAPLVLNGSFDVHDLRLWNVVTGVWDGTQNNAGSTSDSGSWKMQKDITPPIDPGRPDATTNGDYLAGEQCIRLPGPGRYLLNGSGKGSGNIMFHDRAVLAFEYRNNGTTDCGGPVDAQGEMTLNNGTSWARPAQPLVIDVPELGFRLNSTIKVRLIGRSGFPSGTMTVWFDGITLDVTSPGCGSSPDTVFCNGFE